MGVTMMTPRGRGGQQDQSLPDVDYGLDPSLQGEWMRMSYAAKYLGLDFSTLFKRAAKGQLTTMRIAPFLTLVKRQEILDWKPIRRGRRPKPQDK